MWIILNGGVSPYIDRIDGLIFSENQTNFYSMFAMTSLTTLCELDLSNATYCGTDSGSMFGMCEYLRILGGFKGLKVDLWLGESPRLVRASLLNVLNKLADVTELGTNPTLTLAADSYHKLIAEEIAIGTNKGWIIAYA
jgi:hypothetical protein